MYGLFLAMYGPFFAMYRLFFAMAVPRDVRTGSSRCADRSSRCTDRFLAMSGLFVAMYVPLIAGHGLFAAMYTPAETSCVSASYLAYSALLGPSGNTEAGRNRNPLAEPLRSQQSSCARLPAGL
jgi:TRAP-type C4-dicarboxylate transport system permease large subunit